MRILVVNAHSRTPSGEKAFQELLTTVKEVIKINNGLLGVKDEYIVRYKENLEDFLYDEASSFSQPGPGREFDTLDFVIISGDLHVLPWHPSNYMVLTLLRMCLKVKKYLFAIGFAMQALVYLSASNLDYPINVINGGGKGGKIGDLGQLQLLPEHITSHDYFLDNVTGDLYKFQHESHEWSPICNTGLHHSRTAKEITTIGKYVIKTPIYRPKKLIQYNSQTDVKDENLETKCYLKKMFLRHWLFNNCGMEFAVPYKGRWEVHSFNFTNKDKAFEVLAESEDGPFVIEYPRIIGVKFTISKRYKETYEIFRNFITKHASDIMSNGKTQNQSVLIALNTARIEASTFKFGISDELDGQPASHRPSTNHRQNLQGVKHKPSSITVLHDDPKVFKHSGYATHMKGKFFFDKNFISSGKVQYDAPPTTKEQKFISRDSLIGKYALGNRRSPSEGELSFLPHQLGSILRHGDKSMFKVPHYTNVMNDQRPKTKGVSICEPLRRESMPDKDPIMYKEEARRLLYPELIDLHHGFDKKVWVPGSMSQSKVETPTSARTTIRINTGFPTYRKTGPVPKIEATVLDNKTVRASDPYVTYRDTAKEHQKKEDEKILGPKKFILSKGPLMEQGYLLSPTSSASSRYASTISKMYANQKYY